ncbi:hypothetical protein [Ruminococcus albus]|uniref:Uncharacterized protein n=1 Tax=Ruminococcus albus (strain ATCC 27210 / DSM 20455 / JCM 14654 / NCDO 2250 / 7) TaxID=697329 RepID=E6UEZ6_RUMA7|nr:hypothetical protein [Ruminococcus albus]ADU22995.1 hypothetical protein Rumal_2516 [Ruminococcus albus 7 = DSM 20455]
MKKEQLTEILDDNIKTYINNIAYELEQSHDYCFDGFGFPIFGETSKEYHEQVYFESYFESYTRKLINGVLEELCYYECADKIVWPEFEYVGNYNGYTNIESEEKFGFEFINVDRKIGYRYTRVKINEIESLLKKEKVEKIVCVEWQNKDDIIGLSYGDKPVEIILLWDLFNELFDDIAIDELKEMYNIFVKRISDAVAKANSMISLITLPGFTPNYISHTRNITISVIRKEISSLSHYNVMNADFKRLEKVSANLITKYKLSEYFLNSQYDLLLTGNSDYAKSFSTSEYLYKYFKNNPMFDYTPIVSSYLKSIEQLLNYICSNYASLSNNTTDISAFTLGKYITYMNQAVNDTIFRLDIRPVKGIIYRCLNSYRIECRNNLFHKDFFNNWNRVEIIRTNTLFLYVAILGSINPVLIKYDEGILNLQYDELFSILDKQRNNRFLLIINGVEYSGMNIEPRNEGIAYIESGLINNSIVFKRFNHDHYDRIELTRDNMPSEIWIIDSFGTKEKRIWPLLKK